MARRTEGHDSNPFMQLLGLCQTPSVEDTPMMDKFRDELTEHKNYVEGAIEKQEKRHMEEMTKLRADLMASAATGGKATDADVNEFKLELTRLEEIEQKFEGMEQQFKLLRTEYSSVKGATAEGFESSITAMEEMKRDVDELRTRAILVPANEAEFEDLRQRVIETRTSDVAEKGQLVAYTTSMSQSPTRTISNVSVPRSSFPAKEDTQAKESKRTEDKLMQQRQDEALARHELLAKYSLMIAMMRKEVDIMRSDITCFKAQEGCNADCIKHLREDMHRNVEAVSIKAGYLALALMENNEDERRRVHSMLREKEKALAGNASGLMLYTTSADKKAVDISNLTESLGLTMDLPSMFFTVELDRTEGHTVGMKLSATLGTCLVIDKIEGGLAMDYNRCCLPPALPLKPGDRVIQVNQVKGYPALLKAELEFKKVHRLVVERIS